MKKIISLSEFKKFCEEHPYREVVYDTRSQEWSDASSTIVLIMKGDEFHVFPFSKSVCLKSGHGVISLDLIKSVEIEQEDNSDATEITLICKHMAHENPYDWSVGEIRHRLTAYAVTE